jgi:glucose-6-phosphate-specific signal transduction histidine kinase
MNDSIVAGHEKTIEASEATRQKLAELMDQIDITIDALRTEVELAKRRREIG